MHRCIEHLPQVVRGYVGRHTDGDASGTIDEQVGVARRQHRRLLTRFVEGGDEVDRILVDIGKQRSGNASQPTFGVAVGGRGIAIYRPEVTLTIDQRVTHAEVLGHPYQRVINAGISVGMVLTQHFAHHGRALFIRGATVQVQVLHRIQDAAVHGLESVAHVWDGATDDDAHCIVQIGRLHFVLQVNGNFVGICRRDFVGHRVFQKKRGRLGASNDAGPSGVNIPDAAPISAHKTP